MASKSAPMFKVSQLSKDLGMKTKELTTTLEEIGISGGSGMPGQVRP